MLKVPRNPIRCIAFILCVPLIVMSGVMVASAFLPLDRARQRFHEAREDIRATLAAERFARSRASKVLEAIGYALTGDPAAHDAFIRDQVSATADLADWIDTEDIDDERMLTDFAERLADLDEDAELMIAAVTEGRRSDAISLAASLFKRSDALTFEIAPMLQKEQREMRNALIDLSGHAGAASGLFGSELTDHVADVSREVEEVLRVSSSAQLNAAEGILIARYLLGILPTADSAVALRAMADGEVSAWSVIATENHGDELAYVEEMSAANVGASADARRMLELADDGRRAEAARLFAGTYLPTVRGQTSLVDAIVHEHERTIDSLNAHVFTDARNGLAWSLGLACLMFAIALATLVASRSLARKVARLSVSADRFALGELDARTDVVGNDELGRLGRTLNDMATKLEHERDRTERVLERTVESGELERTQLAADLHDGPVQRLTAVLYGLERATLRIGRGETDGVSELVQAARVSVGEEVRALRHMMSELRPPALDERGFAPAIGDYANEFASSTGVDVSVDLDVEERLLPSLETTIYRVVQEALANVAKHASAKHARVTASSDELSVRLTIEDDGVGFDPATREDGGTQHYGLTAMVERTRLAGGHLFLESVPGAGTKVVASFPRIRRAA